MSTRSHIGYVKNGIIRGTYCHFDGYFDSTGKALISILKTNGEEKFQNIIELGIKASGFRFIDEEGYETYKGDSGEWLFESREEILKGEEWGYLLEEDGSLTVFKYSEPFISLKKENNWTAIKD